MTRWRAIVTLVVTAVLAGCDTPQAPVAAFDPPLPASSPVVSPPPSPVPTPTPQVHDVSLPALQQRQFDGRDLKLGPVLARTNAYTRYHATYHGSGLKISGIMNIPTAKGPFPLLVLNHGYIDPDIYTNGRGLKREQDYLARHGYAVLHPDYRNHAESDDEENPDLRFRLGYAEDAINAVLAVRAAKLPQVDATRVGMLGHSMGGGVTLNVLVTQPDLVSAAVLFAPVSGDVRDNFERWTKRRPEVVEKIIAAYGTPDQDPTFWDNLSPLTFISSVSAPVLIHHGTADDSVPLAWSKRLGERLQAAGKDVTLHIYDGEPHEFINAWPEVMRRTKEFFDKHLKQ